MNEMASTTTQSTIADESIVDDMWFRVLKYTLYAIMFLISLPGNLMVCLVITRRQKMKTITNFLILNIAVSDVLYTIYVPVDIVIIESESWPYADFFCNIFYPLMTLSICVSALTLMALALSRFWAVVFPLRRQVSVLQVKILLVVIWLLSIIQVLPYAIVLHVSSESTQCTELWPSEENKKIYTVILFLLQFVIPLTAITFAYTMVGLELKKSSRKTNNQVLEQTRNEESKKIIRMLVIVTLTFAFCNLPTSTMWMIKDFGSINIAGFDDIIPFFNILDFANAAANPCIYLACNEDFRREFRRYLTKLRRKINWSSQQMNDRSSPSRKSYEQQEKTTADEVSVANTNLDPTSSMLVKTSESSL